MPNWVRNKVYIEKKEVIKDCYGKDESGEENFDFEKIIPMPKSLHLTSGGNQNIAIHYAISLMSDDERENLLNKLKEKKCSFYGSYFDKIFKSSSIKEKYTKEEYEKENKELKDIISGKKKQDWENIDYKGLGIKNLQDLGNTYINNILQYGCDTWYDWSCENWGTKWGACHTYYIDENNIEFDTAWSCPYNIFKEISKKYDTKVKVDFADEDIGSNCGRLIFNKGKEVSFIEGDRYFAYKIWDYTDEDIEEIEREQEEND